MNKPIPYSIYVVFSLISLATLAQSSVPISPYLTLVAAADGKAFFADRVVVRNWTSAKEYCISLGMKLASITSKTQEAALVAAYHSTNFAGGHWLSGRDAQLGRQFTWDETGDEVSSALVFTRQTVVQYQTCLQFYSTPGNDSGLIYWRCDRGSGTLCET